SVRDYDPQRPVPTEIIRKILEAGRMAPSACNYQPWEFWLIQSPEMLAKVRDCYYRPWFKEAPHILVVVGYRDKAWVRKFDGYNSLETDLGIVMTHIILAAENEGVSTCYIEAYDPDILRKALNLNDNQVVYGITPLGYPRAGAGRKGSKDRKMLDELVRYL
ncbi:MAG: nitroreductase family protein, partial [Bacteroidales bacterium]|nr:nitroreductase family protein [Bacteroidales bacterium]